MSVQVVQNLLEQVAHRPRM